MYNKFSLFGNFAIYFFFRNVGVGFAREIFKNRESRWFRGGLFCTSPKRKSVTNAESMATYRQIATGKACAGHRRVTLSPDFMSKLLVFEVEENFGETLPTGSRKKTFTEKKINSTHNPTYLDSKKCSEGKKRNKDKWGQKIMENGREGEFSLVQEVDSL